jgi:hypothetical protein
MKRLSSLRFPAWTLPVAMLLLCLLALGVILPALGFYWDDWAKILVSRVFGMDGYWAYYAEDRPFSGWTHILFTPLLGGNPLHWQIFTLALTGLSGWAMYWLLSLLWPRARWQSAAASLLFVVYPVFVSHPIALTFHQQWLQYLLLFLSLACMAKGVRAGRTLYLWPLTMISLALSVAQLSVTEYFAPLELLRPLLLWVLVRETHSEMDVRFTTFAGHHRTDLEQKLFSDTHRRSLWRTTRQALLLYLPYGLLIVGYGVYRLFLIRLPGADPYRAETLYGLVSQPIPTLLNLARVMAQDLLAMLVSCWTQIIHAGPVTSIAPFTLFTLLAGAIIAALAFVYLHQFEPDEDLFEPEQQRWILEALLIGLFGVLLGAAPAWLTGREVVFDFHSDRYAQPALFGASLVWVALVEWIAGRRLQKSILVAILLGLAALLQLNIANDYRWTWKSQLALYWQLYWRAPGLQAGTALLFEKEPIPNQGGFSTSAALNLLYPQSFENGVPRAEQLEPGPLNYWMYSLQGRFANGDVDPRSMTFYTQFRTLVFQGQSPRTVVLSYDTSQGSCVWVMNADDALNPFVSGLVKDFLPASNLDNLLAQPQGGWTPPADLFGKEPAHDWCYYYEKADLARQQGLWDVVVSLGDEARQKGYSPTDQRSNAPREWMPFLEGYLRLERWDEARAITHATYAKDARFNRLLCAVWQRSAAGAPELGAVQQQLQCSAVQ